MKLKSMIGIIVIAAVIFVYDLALNPGSDSAPEGPLVISCTRWPGFMPLIIGVDRGIFKNEGIDVEYRFSDNIRQNNLDFSAGMYDGGCFKLGTVISRCALDKNLKIVLMTDMSNGADALLAAPDIKDINNLKGKRVAFRFGSYAEVVVDMLFKNKKIKMSDLVVMNWSDESSACELLAKGLVDALFIREPYVSELAGLGYNVLASSADIPGTVPQVIVFRNETIAGRHGDINKFVKGWFSACEFLKKEPEASAEIIKRLLKLPASDLSLKGIELSTLPENIDAFKKSGGAGSMYRHVRLYSDYFVKMGILKERLDIDGLITGEFLNVK